MDYAFTLNGEMPLLMHADDVMASDTLAEWRKSPANKSVSVAGDDRSPAWTWHTYLYHDGKHLTMPQECLMAALRTAGSRIASKGKSTFKALTQSGLLVAGDHCRFEVDGEQIAMADIVAMRHLSFTEQLEACKDLGFDLLVKRAKVGTAKHVRVRPRFSNWTVSGEIQVSEPAITEAVLVQLFELAGRFAGLGDWRPSAPTKPGPHGMFRATVQPISKSRKSA